MKDGTKRRIIHLLNRFDVLTGKSKRGRGWNPTNLMYDKHDDADELGNMTGKALDRELRRQVLFALPVLLFLFLLIVAVIFVLCVW